MSDAEGVGLAAIPFDRGKPVDAVVAEAVRRLRNAGHRVAGALQEEEILADGCCGPMTLADVAGGGRTVISQALGPSAKGCRLDPQALAAVAGRLARALEDRPDLLILNRFGKAEAEGGGLRSVLERAIAVDIPVLVTVRRDFLPDFEAFHGGLAILLPADAERVVGWVGSVARRHGASPMASGLPLVS